MKISKKVLQKIIKEELKNVLEQKHKSCPHCSGTGLLAVEEGRLSQDSSDLAGDYDNQKKYADMDRRLGIKSTPTPPSKPNYDFSDRGPDPDWYGYDPYK